MFSTLKIDGNQLCGEQVPLLQKILRNAGKLIDGSYYLLKHLHINLLNDILLLLILLLLFMMIVITITEFEDNDDDGDDDADSAAEDSEDSEDSDHEDEATDGDGKRMKVCNNEEMQ